MLALQPLPYDEAGTLLAITPGGELIRVEKPTIEISVSWDDITDKPTTVAGYGITDVFTKTESDERYAPIEHTHHVEDIVDFPDSWSWDDITDTPTTLDGYGIADAYTKTESDERYAPIEHTHHVEDIVDFPQTWDWENLTGKPQSSPEEIDNVVNNAVINGQNPPVNIQTTQGNIQLSPQGKIVANSNIDLAVGNKILATVTVNGNPVDLAIVQVENYLNVVNPITGEVYADWLQTDFGNTHTPLNLSHSNNPITGKYIAYDVGAWIYNTTDYPAMSKQILATFTEGILKLDSKYFTPVDNGSGGLILSGITWSEIQTEYYKYQAGLTAIQTNKSGLISISDISFTINDAIIYFNYRFSLGDYDTGLITIYQVLISATQANIVTQVNLLHTFTLSDNNFTDFYKNLIETTNQQTQENTTAIEALNGAIIFIGEINLKTDDVTQPALTDRAAELGYPTLQRGYTLVDLDNNQWTYNGMEWINIGNNNVSTATNETLGVVKGSTDNLKVSVDIGGEMTVNGLESALNNKANKGTTLMDYGIADAYTKIEADASFAKTVHTHTVSQITDFPTTWNWNNITNTPTTLAGYGVTAKYAGSQTDGGAADSAVKVNIAAKPDINMLEDVSGLYGLFNTTGSVNYPSEAGLGLRLQRSSGSSVTTGNSIIDLWSAISVNSPVYIRRAQGNGTDIIFGEWQQLLTTDSGYTQTQINTLLSGYVLQGIKGTWSPELTGSSTSGSGVEYVPRYGGYCIQGKIVTVYAYIAASFTTKPTGTIIITGYTPQGHTIPNDWLYITGIAAIGGTSNGNSKVSGFINNNGNLTILAEDDDGVNTDISRLNWNVVLTNSLSIRLSITYFLQ